MKIFVCHYSKLTDRKKHILNEFQKHNITDYEFIEKYDKDEITLEESNIFDKQYMKSKMSLHLKHFYLYKIISEQYENALILEDDAILSDNFSSILKHYISQIPENYDMVFLGDGCNLHIDKHNLIPNKNIYEKYLHPPLWDGKNSTRCTDSYIISKKCAITFCNYINNLKNKIDSPIDWWLHYAAMDNNLKIYWAEPTIVTQGSGNGLFKKTLI